MEWLYSQDLVGKLISKLDPAEESDVHANSAVALVGFISQQQQMHWSASLPSAQSRFTSSLVATESVSALLERLFKGSPSTLEHGLTVLVELVRHSTSASRLSEDSWSAVVVEVLKRMGDFVEVRISVCARTQPCRAWRGRWRDGACIQMAPAYSPPLRVCVAFACGLWAGATLAACDGPDREQHRDTRPPTRAEQIKDLGSVIRPRLPAECRGRGQDNR